MKIFQLIIFAVLFQFSKQVEILSKIINGNKVSSDSVSYQVQIIIFSRRRPIQEFQCTGSLISNQHVVTARHCVEYNVGFIRLYLGSTENLQGLRVQCRRCWQMHNDKNKNEGDIAVIAMPRKVEFTETIRPIKLPSRSDAKIDLTGKTALISGWGRFTNEDITDTLREVEVTIAAPEICEQYFWGYDEGSQICLKVTNEQTECKGDSGGPLVIDGKLFGVTTGATPHGTSCTGAELNIFVRVTSYLDWIQEVAGIEIED